MILDVRHLLFQFAEFRRQSIVGGMYGELDQSGLLRKIVVQFSRDTAPLRFLCRKQALASALNCSSVR